MVVVEDEGMSHIMSMLASVYLPVCDQQIYQKIPQSLIQRIAFDFNNKIYPVFLKVCLF